MFGVTLLINTPVTSSGPYISAQITLIIQIRESCIAGNVLCTLLTGRVLGKSRLQFSEQLLCVSSHDIPSSFILLPKLYTIDKITRY